MRFDVMTLFPEMIERTLGESIIGRAQEKGLIEVRAIISEIIQRTSTDALTIPPAEAVKVCLCRCRRSTVAIRR